MRPIIRQVRPCPYSCQTRSESSEPSVSCGSFDFTVALTPVTERRVWPSVRPMSTAGIVIERSVPDIWATKSSWLVTTAAMVVGLVPLVTAHGAGAASRFSIGVVVVAGMSIGTLFTLFVLPAVYTVLAKDHAAAAHSVRARELAEVS